MQAVHQSDAAVVRPDIFRSLMKIVPAPRKPTPETTDVVIRPMLTPMEALPSATTSATVWLSISDTSAAPTHTSTCVRMPAGRFLFRRSDADHRADDHRHADPHQHGHNRQRLSECRQPVKKSPHSNLLRSL